MVRPFVLLGGSGTRFWRCRELLSQAVSQGFGAGESAPQQTYRRLAEPLFGLLTILANQEYRSKLLSLRGRGPDD
jgi:mannose-1-phosphate guanylyltransferase